MENNQERQAMTFTEQIEAALKLPVDDQALLRLSGEIMSMPETKFSERIEKRKVIHALLLQIRDLQAQVENERWRDANKEKPEIDTEILAMDDGTVYLAELKTSGRWYSVGSDGDCDVRITPTHWKPINLPICIDKIG